MTRRVTLPPAVASDDRGATLVLSALGMVAVVIIAAIVIDLGHERMMRRNAQSVSDMAALAGAQALTQSAGPDPVQGCLEAVQYLRLNIDNLPASTDIPCGDLAVGTCTETTPRGTVTDGGTALPYRIEISWPVPNADIRDDQITDPEGLREFDGHEDGDQCDRFAVDVQIEQSRFFSKIVADGDLTGSAEAVARRLPYEDTRVPNLWLLEPYECDVLEVNGGSELVVGDTTVSGLITADSDGRDCGNNNFVVFTNGAGSTIDAVPNSQYPNVNNLDPPGEIELYAMEPGQQGCAKTSAEGNVNACDWTNVASKNIDPEPTRRSTRATRAPVDWAYNCKTDYPDYHGVSLRDCGAAGERAPYIDLLTAWVDDNVLSTSSPAGWEVYGDDPSERCNKGNWTSSAGKNVYVDCSELRIGNGEVFAVTGGNVVFDGGVTMTGGRLIINDTPLGTGSTASATLPATDCDTGAGFLKTCFAHAAKDAVWIYQQKGNFKVGGGSVEIHNGVLVQETPASVGTENIVDVGSAGVSVLWHAPTVGPLRSLALWSGSYSTGYRIGSSGATVDLEGVFFAPEAYPFTLAGGSNLLPQAAQFVSRTLKVTGGGTLILGPLGIPLIELPPPASVLIR
jgi:hypothetical protein